MSKMSSSFLITMMIFASSFLVSCSRGPVPESVQGVLKKYIELSFSIEKLEDKKKLLELLTGEAKSGLESWNDGLFESAFITRKRKFEKLRFIENKKNSDKEHGITYELTFRDDAQGGVGARILQRKMAIVIRENEQWKIREVRALKELVEYSDGMSFP